MKKIVLFAISLFAFASCTGDDASENLNADPADGNKVLLLKTDYTTHAFEGGTEFSFDEAPETFTLSTQYVPPGDFGNLKIFYDELDFKLFDGDITWMGSGELFFPENFDAPDSFEHVLTDDYVTPSNGFEVVFEESGQNLDYMPAWSHVQGLSKVRAYLQSNPQAKVNVFLYTPSVGIGNPEEWDWYFILKN